VHSILRLVEHGAGVSILYRSLKGHFPYLKINYIDLPDITETTEVVLAFNTELFNNLKSV